MMQQSDSIYTYSPYGEADFWRVRYLLIETYPLTPLGFNWEIRRWDGARFHYATDDWLARCASRIQLWETAGDQVVGVVNLEGALALLASLLVTATYHLGYPKFQGVTVLLPMLAVGLMSIAYLLSRSPLAPMLSHMTMHVAAVLFGLYTAMQLPPHY